MRGVRTLWGEGMVEKEGGRHRGGAARDDGSSRHGRLAARCLFYAVVRIRMDATHLALASSTAFMPPPGHSSLSSLPPSSSLLPTAPQLAGAATGAHAASRSRQVLPVFGRVLREKYRQAPRPSALAPLPPHHKATNKIPTLVVLTVLMRRASPRGEGRRINDYSAAAMAGGGGLVPLPPLGAFNSSMPVYKTPSGRYLVDVELGGAGTMQSARLVIDTGSGDCEMPAPAALLFRDCLLLHFWGAIVCHSRHFLLFPNIF